MASSSSFVRQKHQVFLSFRGIDTRKTFTNHLHAALKRNGTDTFHDDNQLERGKEIAPELLTKIEDSAISIIILSKNYASSSWCLDELSKILECKNRYGQIVVPIFYYVDPVDVRRQTGTFEEAFAELQERFKDVTEKLQRWRAALTEVANLRGFHLHAEQDRYESEIIEDIVKDISKKLIHKSSYDLKGPLVGIDSCLEKIASCLCLGSKDVRILGIWGMGGIGKTTIAEVIFQQLSVQFEACYILTNVREKSEKYGWINLRDEFLRNILEEKNLNIGICLVPSFIRERLCHQKVLIIVDDVDDSMQLDILCEKYYFGPGSRIIVTSRDKQVLKHAVDEIYELKGLNDSEALQLFSLYAFRQSHPTEDFMELSKEVVHYAKGIPLALRVVSSVLYGRRKLDWKGHLEKLKRISHPKIDNILKISYDELDDEVKDMFLYIACFFEGKNIDYVVKLLNDHYGSVMSGINVLIDKSLVTISHNKLEVHDLLQKMGQNIFRQEYREPSKRNRSWTTENIYHMLKNNMSDHMIQLEPNNMNYGTHQRGDGWSQKVKLEWMFVIINFVLEIPSAVFDQLSSVHKPQYALISMLLSFITMLLSIIEIIYKGREEGVVWRRMGTIPWFYYPLSDLHFGTFADIVRLACAIPQFIVAAITYGLACRNVDNPIKISVWPIIFAFGLLCSKFSKNPIRRNSTLK